MICYEPQTAECCVAKQMPKNEQSYLKKLKIKIGLSRNTHHFINNNNHRKKKRKRKTNKNWNSPIIFLVRCANMSAHTQCMRTQRIRFMGRAVWVYWQFFVSLPLFLYYEFWNAVRRVLGVSHNIRCRHRRSTQSRIFAMNEPAVFKRHHFDVICYPHTGKDIFIWARST